MLKWPTDDINETSVISTDIVDLVDATLRDAGQLKYLSDNYEKISKTHAIIIDVDWYRERTQSDVGFHKDSRGTTLFVNLTYDNPNAMQGASTKLDREGQRQLEDTLPAEVQKDLRERRENYKKIEPHEEYGDLKEEEVEPYARISFSDLGIWHTLRCFAIELSAYHFRQMKVLCLSICTWRP